jgi:hypothetical protein
MMLGNLTLLRNVFLLGSILTTFAHANDAHHDLIGPAGSNSFGASVTVLPNGNIVVTDPHSSVAAFEAGAVYLYSPNGMLISTLTGTSFGDAVGAGAVTVLTNGNFVISSPAWQEGANFGAVTWVDGTLGLSGQVSVSNSLVGTNGNRGAVALTNGNYVVASPGWTNGDASSGGSAGAVTWCKGTGPTAAVVSKKNSIVGTTSNDQVGRSVTALTNGNYVVSSPTWHNGGVLNAGAVTWGSGIGGTVGAVSENNSLVGSKEGDEVGDTGVTALSNGNYVVASVEWSNGSATYAGAVTWGDGLTGVRGVISASNSLVGTIESESVGGYGVVALANGNYVVACAEWSNDTTHSVGAVTWGNGRRGTKGTVTAKNSLTGSNDSDQVGFYGVTPLTNGNYVVLSPKWSNGTATEAGAATWADGTKATVGIVSPLNSLVGTTANDNVGFSGATALINGNYVVGSYQWANGDSAMAGAATWGDGTQGTVGPVSILNSLVGTQVGDSVGSRIVALTNGNYVLAVMLGKTQPLRRWVQQRGPVVLVKPAES